LSLKEKTTTQQWRSYFRIAGKYYNSCMAGPFYCWRLRHIWLLGFRTEFSCQFTRAQLRLAMKYSWIRIFSVKIHL